MKNLKLLAFCLILLPFAAPMMSAAGSGQAQITLMQSAKTDGDVIFTSTLEPTSPITYSGQLGINTTATRQGSFSDAGNIYAKEVRTCTATISFKNLILREGFVNETDTLAGRLSTGTLSYTADWSLSAQNSGSIQYSINPSSGHASGSFSVDVFGIQKGGWVVFGFFIPEGPKEMSFPVIITATDSSQKPPWVITYTHAVLNPVIDSIFALNDAGLDSVSTEGMDLSAFLNTLYTYGKIESNQEYTHQYLIFDGNLSEGAGTTGTYTGDLALTVEGTQITPLATITPYWGCAVEIQTAQGNTWESAVAGSALRNGDRIRTRANSKAKVMFSDGSYIILGPNSSYEVGGILEGPTIWDILNGKCYFLKMWLQQHIGKKFEVRTPSAVTSARGTEFTVEVAEDNATTVTVFEGMVDVQDRTSGSNVTIATNQTLTIHPVSGGLTPQEMSALITEVDTASVDRWWETSTPSTYSLTIESSTGGSTDPPAETYTQDAETTLAVTAYPDNGYTLNHWLLDGANAGNSNPFTVHFNADHTLQPVFTQGSTTQHTLTIQQSTGGSTSPTGTCTQNAGTTLTVTATPNNGYTLNHWLLDGVNVGGRNPLTVAFNSNHVLQPVFTQSGLPAFSPLSVAGVAGVVIALIAVAVALRRRRRKPRASSPGEPVKPEAKPTTPPEAVELEMSTRQKFVFCPECGEKLPNLNAKFCPFCGARLGLQP
jgi:hypothetical protein